MSDERIQTGDLVDDASDDPMARDDATQQTATEERLEPLFDTGRATQLRDRWHALQANFVDDPRAAVGEADSLVAELLHDLAQSFDQARSGLETQWNQGDDVSTEELRITLQRYRSFFERILSV